MELLLIFYCSVVLHIDIFYVYGSTRYISKTFKMPKRKHNKANDLYRMKKELEKLLELLKRARRQTSSSSYESDDSELNNYSSDNGLPEDPYKDLEIDDSGSQSEDNLSEVSNIDTIQPQTYDDSVNLDQMPTAIATTECENTELDKDTLEVLDDDSSCSVQHGEEVHKELS